jgi:vacuolar-type H+-ATPase subunit C/Vma6
MRSPKTIYLIARAHGLREHLLKSDSLVQILRLKSLSEVYDFLLKSEYARELSLISLKELGAYQLEKIFYQKLSQRFYFLFLITSGRTREALEYYCRRIEVENLKRITRAIHSKEKISEDNLIPIPRKYQTINFPALLQSQSVKEMILFLRETEYKNLAKILDLYEQYNNPTIVEARADVIYYELLWERLGRIQDKEEIKDLIGTEIDLKNLLNILFLKYTKAKVELLRQTVINVSHGLPKSLLQEVDEISYQRIPELVTRPKYVELIRKSVELMNKGMMSEAESTFSRYLYSYAETIALRYPNNLAYVFAYLYLCHREARNLTTLTTGKQLKLGDERIQSLLFL